jgi:hypothetical protein
MPLTQEQVDQINADIELAARAAGPIVEIFGPQATVALLLGKAMAKLVPETVAIIERWIAGQDPTPEEKANMAAELSVLSDPNLP